MTIQFVFVESDTELQEVGVDLAEVVVQSNLAKTKTEARRQITAGAIRLNDRKVVDPFARLVMADNEFIVVQKNQSIDPIEK